VVSSLAVPVTLALCLVALLVLGLIERWARDRAWRAVPIRVHVNGTRGKSTVTRLIWSALREAGVPAMAKTTGTAARLLLPDGTERPIRRRAPASIREQLWVLREARRRGARALVVECMALDPDLQHSSEAEMIRATVGVITNVRLDHTEVMGPDLEAVAAALSLTVPRAGIVVCGDARALPAVRIRADSLGTRVVEATATSDEGGWMDEDIRVALAATRVLGLDDEVARRGVESAPADPGAAAQGRGTGRGPIDWLDATAANDPESLETLVGEYRGRRSAEAWPDVVVYNHRADRAPRLACFVRHSRVLAAAGSVIVTGDPPPLSVWRAMVRTRSGTTRYVARRGLESSLQELQAGSWLVFCGNTRGFDVPRLGGANGHD
jgi:gamma-polyglutamate synthase